jgi:hypothetical protein
MLPNDARAPRRFPTRPKLIDSRPIFKLASGTSSRLSRAPLICQAIVSPPRASN